MIYDQFFTADPILPSKQAQIALPRPKIQLLQKFVEILPESMYPAQFCTENPNSRSKRWSSWLPKPKIKILRYFNFYKHKNWIRNEFANHLLGTFNILNVYQADKSPNTNFCYQAKFFICFYTYYEGHYWPKKLLIYVWTLKLIVLVFCLWIRYI